MRLPMIIEGGLPTERYIEDHDITLGTYTKCVRRILRQGGDECYRMDWLFPDLDKSRIGGTYVV